MKTSISSSLRAALISGALAFTFLGCASTHLKSSWRDPAYPFSGIRKILIIGIGPQDKESTRRVLEDAFVQNFAKKGAQGIPAYSLSPANAQLDEAAWKRLITENQIPAVLVVRLVDTKTVEREVPPTTTTVAVGGAPAPVYNNGGFIGGTGTYNPNAYNNAYNNGPSNGYGNSGWYGYYQNSYQVMSTPGYTVKDQYAVVDSKLFDVASGKMVWTAASDTAVGQGVDNGDLAKQFAHIVTESIYKP